jgi:hypothetical protein
MTVVGTVNAGATSTSPGTAAQVAALVRAAKKIESLSSTLDPSLAKAGSDLPTVATPSLSGCILGGTNNTDPCVFGDVTGKKTMVLWGDSHAEMWFPALDAVAKAEKWRLVALIDLGCPVAEVATTIPESNTPNVNCPIWRAHMVTRINALDPQLVVISESWYPELASGAAMTDAIWKQGVEATLRTLDSKGTKRAVIGDTVFSSTNIFDPVTCLSEHPTDIQLCDVTDTPTLQAERLADADAAKATSNLYINEVPWECSTVCTPIVGHFVVYYNLGHLTAVYGAYLTMVLEKALKPDL